MIVGSGVKVWVDDGGRLWFSVNSIGIKPDKAGNYATCVMSGQAQKFFERVQELEDETLCRNEEKI